MIRASGQAYGELNRLEKAQAYYDALESPADRAYFAAGVLVGLAASR